MCHGLQGYAASDGLSWHMQYASMWASHELVRPLVEGSWLSPRSSSCGVCTRPRTSGVRRSHHGCTAGRRYGALARVWTVQLQARVAGGLES